MIKRLGLLVGIAAAIALFLYFDLGQYFSLESLKSNRDKLDTLYQENAWEMILELGLM